MPKLPAKCRFLCQVTMKILFLVPYPLKLSPSQRFRFEQYFKALEEKRLTYETQSFLDSHTWQIFFKPGQAPRKAWLLLRGFLRRLFVLMRVPAFDYIFIHREVTPLGPPVFEWIIAHIFRKKIIYDFDDAIWLTDRAQEPWLLRTLKWRSKVAAICRWSYKVSVGNHYLGDYARQYNANVVYNPTTLDTDSLHNPAQLHKRHQPPRLVIGWTGSHSTLKYLEPLQPVLAALEKRYPQLLVHIIADRRSNLDLQSLVFVPWNLASEIEDLYQLDIGIMPLPDDEWSKGKCGFKALQYMSLGIPTVASPVGVNVDIVADGVNGLLATTPEEWEQALVRLMEDPALRHRLGEHGKTTVLERYSVRSNTASVLSLFT